MKTLKMLSLAVLASLMAMAFAGAGSAQAEEPVLCSADEEVCGGGNVINHTHLTGRVTLRDSSGVSVICDVLFLGTVRAGWFGRLIKTGRRTYTNCREVRSGKACTAEDISEESILALLKTGHETASVIGEGEFKVKCGIFINCVYNWEGLEGTATGPLLSVEENGDLSIQEQELTKVSGLCPSTNKLTLVSTPLTRTYITR